MSLKTIGSVFAFLVIVAISIFAHDYHRQDQEYRQLHGRVTPVTLFNWEGEVETQKDKIPILLYFHAKGSFDEQQEAIKTYAWNNAGKVKVVSVSLDKPENLLLALQFEVIRHPAYVVIYKTKEARGPAGVPIDRFGLQRLVDDVVKP